MDVMPTRADLALRRAPEAEPSRIRENCDLVAAKYINGGLGMPISFYRGQRGVKELICLDG